MDKPVTLVVTLTGAKAQAYAQFLKRVYYSDYRSNAVDEAEAYTMLEAGEEIRKALADAGYAPR